MLRLDYGFPVLSQDYMCLVTSSLMPSHMTLLLQKEDEKKRLNSKKKSKKPELKNRKVVEKNTKLTINTLKLSALFVTTWDKLQLNISKYLISKLFLFRLRKYKKRLYYTQKVIY